MLNYFRKTDYEMSTMLEDCQMSSPIKHFWKKRDQIYILEYYLTSIWIDHLGEKKKYIFKIKIEILIVTTGENNHADEF